MKSKKVPQAPAVVNAWKRGMAIGCSHGHLLDPLAGQTVCDFAKRWKPHTAIHLGDHVDMTAFMKGGTADTREDPYADFSAGSVFLSQFFEASGAERRILTLGNHEDRLWKLRESPREVVSFAANQGILTIERYVGALGATLVEYDNTKLIRLGNFAFFHGFMFSENTDRDHAEAFGNCVHAHWHRVGYAKGRRSDNPTAVSVGTLACIPGMEYAKTNRSRLAWAQGFAFFEYCDHDCHVWLVEGPHADENGIRTGAWRLPL